MPACLWFKHHPLYFHLNLGDDGVLLIGIFVLLRLKAFQGIPVVELEVVHRDALQDVATSVDEEGVT